MEYGKHEAGRLVGCSVRGPKHVEDDIPCQDSWRGDQLQDGRFVIAVGDGLGSASLSHEGSKLATNEAVDVLKENLASIQDVDQESLEESIKDAITSARTAVFEEAERLDEQPSELSTTLLVVVADSSDVAGAVVGDGGIVYAHQGSYDLLVEREMAVVDLSASNVTIPLLHDDWEMSYRFGYRENCDGVAVFTDGLDEFAWDKESANSEFFDPVFDLVRDIPDVDEAAQELSDALKKEPYRNFNDDKTIAIADFPPAFDSKEAKLVSGEPLSMGEIVKFGTKSCISRIEESSLDAVKIFFPRRRKDSQIEEKIAAMIETPPERSSDSEGEPVIAWPTQIVESSDDDQFLGYKMAYPKMESRENLLEAAQERSRHQNERSSNVIETFLERIGLRRDEELAARYEIALSLAKGVNALHQREHAIGALHHETFLTDGDNVLLTNCDTFHIRGENKIYEGGIATPRYAPPEDSGETLEEIQRRDQFGLAVLIFQLLMDGFHPFQARGTEAVDGDFQTMIRTNPFPYRDPISGKLEPVTDAPSFADLPVELRSHFERCFIEGKTLPEARPTAESWEVAFESVC